MVSILHQSSSFVPNKPSLFLRRIHLSRPVNLSVKSQQESSTEETTSENAGNTSTGQGFGSSASSSAAAPAKKKPEKGKRQRASILRREPVEKPSFAMPQQDGAGKAEEMGKNESAFLLAWLGLGAVILVEGLALAASGFLPEAWDGFLVKYLYPSFTPTVVLFVCGTVGYGVLKYLQNENSSKEN